MHSIFSIFPARREWPVATDDVINVPLEVESLRLTSRARNIGNLANLKRLKALWCFNINENDLESICNCNSLESLFIEDIKMENLDILKKLNHLKILGLETCPKVSSLEAVRNLQLFGLSISHFKNVHDLTPLAGLTSLRALAVSGSMYTRMEVRTFKPLAELQGLEFLHLTNIKPDDGTIKPLGGLSMLRQLDIANFYPTCEFAWLSQRLQSTECSWFKPYTDVNYMDCTKCGESTMVMLTGKRKPTVCKDCDKHTLEKHIREWDECTQQNV